MTKSTEEKPQSDKFRDLARELEADEDEASFEERVRRVAGAAKALCPHCHGTGGKKAHDTTPAAQAPDDKSESCSHCGGTGYA
jgi:DnaJ-class molecular chaperone